MRSSLANREYVPTVGDLFQSFFQPASRGSNGSSMTPAIDVLENAENFTIAVDVPGYTMDQIDVQLGENVLTISGEHTAVVETKDPKKNDDMRWHIVERSRGSFSRSIKFPVPVDAANVKAALKGGVLTVTVPKGVEARAQKIKITEA